jgi:phage shock protein PspC (stress-responsive transcriptional regulator)
MNKTLTINISGIVFNVEEPSYERLSKYLSDIKNNFSSADEAAEIMADVEARVAELLGANIKPFNQVIVLANVEAVISQMGNPEDFNPDASATLGDNRRANDSNSEKNKRRFFRDPDKKEIGGVCGGIAGYFDVDVTWVRIFAFLLFFFGGLSLWVYLILWIIIPEAKTTADKLSMRGEAINVNNISKTIKEEAEQLKERFKKYGNDFKGSGYGDKIKKNVNSLFFIISNVVRKFIGLVLLMLGASLLFVFCMSLFGISISGHNTDIQHWRSLIFDSISHYILVVISLIIVFGIPTLMLVYSGIKLLFNIRYKNRWVSASIGVLWLLGVLLAFYEASNTVKQFAENTKIKEQVKITFRGDTLILKINPADDIIKQKGFDNYAEITGFSAGQNPDILLGEKNGKLSIIKYIDVDVLESSADTTELIIYRSSKGITKREANRSAKTIGYNYAQTANRLLLDEVSIVNEEEKFKMQDVDVKIKLPIGKVIYFDNSLKYILNNIDNVSNTWDGDMVGRHWKMTDKGLVCLDCVGL